MDREILTAIFSFIAGILVSSFVFISPILSAFFVVVALSILLAEKIHQNGVGKEVLLVSLTIVSFGLGSLRYSIKDFHEPVVPALTGIVVSEPERRDSATRFVFHSDNGEKALVSTDMYSIVEYGDRVELEGKFKTPGVIEGEDGRSFDYAKYLSKDDIYETMSFAEVAVVSKNNGNSLLAALFKMKQSFVGKMREVLPEPQASLLAGLLVAGKDAMPKDILEEFKRAGVVHIVVLSGYNLTIIADSLRRLAASWLPKAATPLSIIGILFFILMTGAEATVVRAGLMVLAVILAKSLGRKVSPGRVLLATAFLMLMENPKILVFDPSFQLSFLATLALVYVSPLIEKYLNKVSEKFGFRGILSTTIATQAVVLPYLIYSMGNFSLVSLPANILILLIIPATMFLGFLAVLVAYVNIVLAVPLTYITHLLLSWILLVSHFIGNLSFASINIPPVSTWLVAAIYILMIMLVWRWRNFLLRSAN
ncbi:MAG: ComEC/Rec2 family competence protein [bacterium]|nr:ComEC/Rec2 family competence protein [bacterium]